MSKRTARHRAPYRLLQYPLPIYTHWLKNRWYAFVKPQLKSKIQRLLGGK